MTLNTNAIIAKHFQGDPANAVRAHVAVEEIINATNPVEAIGAEFTKCRAADADPRAVDVLREALNCTLKEHGFQVVNLEDVQARERSGGSALSREAIRQVAASAMESGRYYYFMALIDEAMGAEQSGEVQS